MKNLLLALAFVFGTTSLFAQSKFHPGLTFNPIFGFLKAQTSSPITNASNKGVKLGFSYGVMADYMFADNYGLNFELRFAHFNNAYQAVSSTGGVSTSVTDIQKVHKQYLQIPVSLKMKTNQIGYIKYFGQFGFAPSINLRTRVDKSVQVSGSGAIDSSDLNYLKLYKPFNIFLIIGGGLEYNFGGSTSLMVGLTFENGFINMARQNDKFYQRNGYFIDLRDKAIVLNLGIFF
jgi:hypothetical protein